MLNNHSSSISVFSGIGCKGNQHVVVRFMGELDEACAKAQSLQCAPNILVCIPSVNASEKIGIKPRFFDSGVEVFLCGSGSLAAAHELFSNDALCQNQEKLVFALRDKTLVLERKGGKLQFTGDFSLKAKKAKFKPYEAMLRTLIVDAVELSDGYAIVELDSVADVKSLNPNVKQIIRESAPAIIVTAKGCDIKEDYVMRYFAPQFGKPEDSATGSANAYLMKYWQLKLNKKRLTGRQLSKAGGLFYGSVKGNTVTLAGRVSESK